MQRGAEARYSAEKINNVGAEIKSFSSYAQRITAPSDFL